MGDSCHAGYCIQPLACLIHSSAQSHSSAGTIPRASSTTTPVTKVLSISYDAPVPMGIGSSQLIRLACSPLSYLTIMTDEAVQHGSMAMLYNKVGTFGTRGHAVLPGSLRLNKQSWPITQRDGCILQKTISDINTPRPSESTPSVSRDRFSPWLRQSVEC